MIEIYLGFACLPVGREFDDWDFGFRGVAQPGSALAWGVRCRRFKSSRPDHFLRKILNDFNKSYLKNLCTRFEQG